MQSSEDSPVLQNAIELVPQPHGGAIRRGNPGNHGGRPPNQLRAVMREALATRIPILEQMADGIEVLTTRCAKCGHEESGKPMPVRTEDRLRALDMLGKFGLGERAQGVSADSVRSKIRATLEVLQRELSPDVYSRLEPELRGIWLG